MDERREKKEEENKWRKSTDGAFERGGGKKGREEEDTREGKRRRRRRLNRGTVAPSSRFCQYIVALLAQFDSLPTSGVASVSFSCRSYLAPSKPSPPQPALTQTHYFPSAVIPLSIFFFCCHTLSSSPRLFHSFLSLSLPYLPLPPDVSTPFSSRWDDSLPLDVPLLISLIATFNTASRRMVNFAWQPCHWSARSLLSVIFPFPPPLPPLCTLPVLFLLFF